MPIPFDAKRFSYQMDPGDVVDFIFDATPAMEDTEAISSAWSITMSPEGAAVGLSIRTDGDYAPARIEAGKKLRFWLNVAAPQQQNSIFLGSGIDIAMTLRWTTNNVPPRTFERAAVVTVRQRG